MDADCEARTVLTDRVAHDGTFSLPSNTRLARPPPPARLSIGTVGGMEYTHWVQSVFSDAKTFSRSIFDLRGIAGVYPYKRCESAPYTPGRSSVELRWL